MLSDDELAALILRENGECSFTDQCGNCQYHNIEIRNDKRYIKCKLVDRAFEELISKGVSGEVDSSKVRKKWAEDYLEAKQAKEKIDHLNNLK
jgi:hypothetical protein